MLTIIRIMSFAISAAIFCGILSLVVDKPLAIGLLAGMWGQIISDIAADWYIDNYML